MFGAVPVVGINYPGFLYLGHTHQYPLYLSACRGRFFWARSDQLVHPGFVMFHERSPNDLLWPVARVARPPAQNNRKSTRARGKNPDPGAEGRIENIEPHQGVMSIRYDLVVHLKWVNQWGHLGTWSDFGIAATPHRKIGWCRRFGAALERCKIPDWIPVAWACWKYILYSINLGTFFLFKARCPVTKEKNRSNASSTGGAWQAFMAWVPTGAAMQNPEPWNPGFAMGHGVVEGRGEKLCGIEHIERNWNGGRPVFNAAPAPSKSQLSMLHHGPSKHMAPSFCSPKW